MTKFSNKKISIVNWKILGVACSLLLVFCFFEVSAYTIQDLPDTEITNDIVLSPGKVELFLNPGESVEKIISITNRTGREAEIVVEVEDFSGSDNPKEALIFWGGGRGSRSLKDYIKFETNEFVLAHGQRMNLPITVRIPEGAEPGGLYGAVFVSTRFSESAGDVGAVSRLGSLFFVKVGGESFEDGWLRKFDTKAGEKFFEKGPVSFEVLFENNGNVHLLPYGFIGIENMFGREVSLIDIDPWFVMPDSLRAREIRWSADGFCGRYKAHLKINRGYGNVVDEAVVTFWVLPWKTILAVIISFVFLAGIVWQIVKKFEIRKK